MKDVVSVAAVTVPDLTFELAVETNERTPGTDGIMGMAYSPPNANPTFWEVAVSQKKVPSSVFSYFIDATDKAGALTLGGMDLARFNGPLAWMPVLPTFSSPGMNSFVYWQVGMTKINIGPDSVALPSVKLPTIFDTGTSLAIFPLDMAASINKQLGLQAINSEGTNASLYGTSCGDGKIPSGLPDLTLTFDDVVLTLPASSYMFIQPDTRGLLICLSGVAGVSLSSAATEPNTIIIGNIFLRQFYTVFDPEAHQIGIANAYRPVNVENKMYAGGRFNSPNGTSPVVTLGGVNIGPKGAGFSCGPSWLSMSLLALAVMVSV